MKKNWLIYGAYGYTGELIAREAVKRGMKPVLAGRNPQKLHTLSQELNLEMRAFSIDAHTSDSLSGIDLVLHCAGPFGETSAAMIEACLAAGAHYLDITGEISVFEHTHAQHERAKRAEIVFCSGVGFDVIPTDCAALKLKELMPDATHLALGFESDSGISRGTYKTMIQGLGSGSAERRDSKLTAVPLGSQRRFIDFGRGRRAAMGIPWGDVATAFYTTAIPNITTWVPFPQPLAAGMKLLNAFQPLLASWRLQNLLKGWAEHRVTGPDEAHRSSSPAYIWGESRNKAGVIQVVRIQTANVYDLTVYGALASVRRVLDGDFEGGSYTPAQLFGSHFLEELPGSGTFEIDGFIPSS